MPENQWIRLLAGLFFMLHVGLSFWAIHEKKNSWITWGTYEVTLLLCAGGVYMVSSKFAAYHNMTISGVILGLLAGLISCFISWKDVHIWTALLGSTLVAASTFAALLDN